MISRTIVQKAALLLLLGPLIGCAAPTPQVGDIQAQKGTTIMTGEEASLTIPVAGDELKFEWTAQKGTLSDSTQPAVIYTAPDSPGPDTVTLKVTYSGGEVIRSITFEVVGAPTPTATETPLPADTPTPTAPPEPMACNLPAVTPYLFPQLANETGQFAMYGPLPETNLLCQAVYDIVHTPGKMAVHVKYENVGTNFAWWGVATPNGYDASQHSQLCFWAYAEKPNQSFRVKMKDMAKTPKSENGVVTTIGVTNQWKQICTNISVFSDLGVQVDKMENINLGFEQPTGSAEIWIADFEFK
jgi:hypothetical protein